MKKKENRGFTIIEVALVLAIAGLIFLMVFIALPAVQRTQRDAKRRDDVGILLTAMQKYQNNNRGMLPSDNGTVTWNETREEAESLDGAGAWVDLYNAFLGENFEDPKGFHYELMVADCGERGVGTECANGNEANDDTSLDEAGYIMYIIRSATCDGSKVVASGNLRKAAVLYKMEGGGGAYCANMQ